MQRIGRVRRDERRTRRDPETVLPGWHAGAYDEPDGDLARSMRIRNSRTISVASKSAVLTLSVSKRRRPNRRVSPAATRSNGRDVPVGIDIRWEYLAHDGASHRVYRFVNGTFAEVEVPQ